MHVLDMLACGSDLSANDIKALHSHCLSIVKARYPRYASGGLEALANALNARLLALPRRVFTKPIETLIDEAIEQIHEASQERPTTTDERQRRLHDRKGSVSRPSPRPQ